MGYDRHIARAGVHKQVLNGFRWTLFLLLAFSVALWPLPGMVAQASPHGAMHHSESAAPAQSHGMTAHVHDIDHAAASEQQEPCADGCRCAGPMMLHCCSQPAPSAAAAEYFATPEGAVVSERHELLVVDEEFGSILPPTPPPKSFYI